MRGTALVLVVVGAIIAVGCSSGTTAEEIEASVAAHRNQIVVETQTGGCVVRPSAEIECDPWNADAEGHSSDIDRVLLDPPPGQFTSIDRMADTLGVDVLCGLRDGGVIVCWVAEIRPSRWESSGHDWRAVTDKWYWEPQLPSQGEFVALAAIDSADLLGGGMHNDEFLGSVCGVASGGGIECRSLDDQHEENPQQHYIPYVTGGTVLIDVEYEFEEPIGEFSAIQTSEQKWNWGDMCGIARDGHVSCWGFEPPVSPDVRFQSVALGLNTGKYDDAHNAYYLMCGVSVEGDLHCWGDFGWLSNPDLSHVVIEGNFVKVKMLTQGSDGDQWICALTAAGQIVCWWSDTNFGDLDGLRDDFDMVSSDPEVLLRRKDAGLGASEPQAFGEGYVDLVILKRTVDEGTMACGVLPDGSMECWVYNIPGLSRIDWNPGPVRVA